MLVNASVGIAIVGTLGEWKKHGHLLLGVTIVFVKTVVVIFLVHSWWTLQPAVLSDASLNFVWGYPPVLVTLSFLEAEIIKKYL